MSLKMCLIALTTSLINRLDIRSCRENFGARQPGYGDATVPSLSQGLEDVISASVEVSNDISIVSN
jgi:hypothetical protein